MEWCTELRWHRKIRVFPEDDRQTVQQFQAVFREGPAGKPLRGVRDTGEIH